MSWRAPEPCIPLARAIPPYREVEPVSTLPALAARRTVPGTLLVLDIHRLALDWQELPAAVLTLRARFPSAPVIFRVYEVNTDVVRLAQRAARLRVRAVVAAGEPLGETLRPIITSPDDLGDDVLEWLALVGRTFSPITTALLRHIFGRGPGFRNVGDLLDTLAEPERTARHRFHRERIPPPNAWHQAARALHSALHVQAGTGSGLLRLALELGYSDHSGLSRQFSRTFGLTPRAVQGTLGWEWLLHRWLGRSGLPPVHAS